MPNLIVTLTPAQAQRIAPAFAFLNKDGSDATAAQIQVWVRRQIVARVKQYESSKANAIADAQINQDLKNEGWN